LAKQDMLISWFAHGDSWIASRRGPHLDAALQLRLRTGAAGPALTATGATFTATAPHDGPIEICSLFPGELRGDDESIVYDRTMPRRLLRGGFDVLVAVWPKKTDVRTRLARAVRHDPSGLARCELDRLNAPITSPCGWEPHRHVPLAGLHQRREHQVDVLSHGRAEIICRKVRVPLTDTLRLRWRWHLRQLPTRHAEDTLLTHDYMAVAVEFDDGRDLSYHWSAALPKETSYRCPLPHWRQREWHLVVGSGTTELGAWRHEDRAIAPDLAKTIEGATPREIVGIWLVVTCVSAGGEARGSYADIAFVDGATTLNVL
jgi:hypothetical protein